MSVWHRDLAAGERWANLPLVEQMANVGSEVERTIRWRDKGQTEVSQRALERALELLDLTIAAPANRRHLRELTRVREALADHFFFENEYRSTDEGWRRYFLAFAVAARRGR